MPLDSGQVLARAFWRAQDNEIKFLKLELRRFSQIRASTHTTSVAAITHYFTPKLRLPPPSINIPVLDMLSTCAHASHISMIQIHNVPSDLHRRLKARAASAGQPLSDYLLAEIRRSAARPALDELRARLATRAPVRASVEPAEILRNERCQGPRHFRRAGRLAVRR